MNIVQTIAHIVKKMLPRLRVKAGEGISVDYADDGATVSCRYPQHPEAVAVWVKNTESSTLAEGSTVILSGTGTATYLPSGAIPTPLDVAYNASIPSSGTTDGIFAVLLDGIEAGKSGRAVLSGTATATITNASGSGAKLAPNGSGGLTPSDAGITPIYIDTVNNVAVVFLGAPQEERSPGIDSEIIGFFRIEDHSYQDSNETWHAKIKVVDKSGLLSYNYSCGLFISGEDQISVDLLSAELTHGTKCVYLHAEFEWNQSGTEGDWNISIEVGSTPYLVMDDVFNYIIGTVIVESYNGGLKVTKVNQMHCGGPIYNNRYA